MIYLFNELRAITSGVSTPNCASSRVPRGYGPARFDPGRGKPTTVAIGPIFQGIAAYIGSLAHNDPRHHQQPGIIERE
jgi:hypothetical protein